MDFAIRGKNAIVIGAGSGLGAASAKALAAEGVHTVLVGRRAEMLAKTQAEIESSGGRQLGMCLGYCGPFNSQRSRGRDSQSGGPHQHSHQQHRWPSAGPGKWASPRSLGNKFSVDGDQRNRNYGRSLA